MKKVGYLGPEGTFSQEAFDVCYKNENALGSEYMNIYDIILGAEKGEIQEAIVPIENSIEGAVNLTLDTMPNVDLNIIKEIVIPIRHNLMSKKGTKKEDIKTIFTHPQPVGQCREYLNKNFLNVQINYTNSTSEGAKIVSNGDFSIATIGTRKAAEIYSLDILEYDIQDNDNNETRFIILSKEKANRTGHDKTSIVFSTENKPGSLYKILDIFSLWDINLTRIESRPVKDKLGRYIFFVDLEGHVDDQNIKDALTMVERKTSFYKILGSYPSYK